MHRTESLYYGIVMELALNERRVRFLSLLVPRGWSRPRDRGTFAVKYRKKGGGAGPTGPAPMAERLTFL
jgi:hypothetical protein